MERILYIFLILCLGIASCRDARCPKGEGPSRKRVEAFDSISSISLDMVADLFISNDTIGEFTQFDVIAQSEMLNILELQELNNGLTIALTDCIREHEPVIIRGKMPNTPERLEINSAGLIKSTELLKRENMVLRNHGLGDIDLVLESDLIDVFLNSSGDIILGGTCRKLQLETVASGDVKAFNLVADTVEIEYLGTNFVEVYASDYLKVNFRIPGSINYRGNPEIIIEGQDGDVVDQNL